MFLTSLRARKRLLKTTPMPALASSWVAVLLQWGGHDGYAAHVAFHQLPDDGLGARLTVLRVEEQHIEAAIPSRILEAADDLGEEGVGDVGDDQAEEVAAAGGEAAGVDVFVVVEMSYDFEDALACRTGDVDAVVEDARYRGERDAGFSGHISRGVHSGGRLHRGPRSAGCGRLG